MKTQMHFYWMLGILFFSTCSKGDIKNDENALEDFEFYIEGVVDGKLLRYQQFNFEWTNVSNKYFIQNHQTWLQAYRDSTDLGEGYWKIRFTKLNLVSLSLPYTVAPTEGRIFWYDSKEDDEVESNPKCQDWDNNCNFWLLPSAANEITITANKDEVIEGTFSGMAHIMATGFTPYMDTTINKKIAKGKFKIKYRLE